LGIPHCFRRAGWSANDQFGNPPYLLAPLKPDCDCPGPDIVHHHGAGLIDTFCNFADPDRADYRVPVQTFQGRIPCAGNFAPDQASAVLEGGQAAGIKPTGQLVDGPYSGKHFHGRLHGAACDGTNLGELINRP
jgi:hypothetical protein